MTWSTVTLVGPPTTNYVPSEAMYDQIATALSAHPIGSWSLVWSRNSPLDPVIRIWKCSAATSGMAEDFYVAFAWRASNTSELWVSLAESWDEGTTTLLGLAFQYAGTTTYPTNAALPYGRMGPNAGGSYSYTNWNVTSWMPYSYCGYSLNGGTNSSAWMGIGVCRDALQISISDTINDIAPDKVYLGAFDSLVAGPNLVDHPICVRASSVAYTPRYPIYASAYVGYFYCDTAPFITASLNGTLGNPATDSAITGPIAYREYFYHTSATIDRGRVRGLFKYMLNITMTGNFYLNDRVTIGEKEFVWTGGWWFDTTV